MEITSPLLYGGPAFILLIIIEIIFSLKYEKELYQWKDFKASSVMGVGAAVLAALAKGITLAFFFLIYFVFNPEDIDGVRQNIFGWQAFGWAWFVWIACQIADDFSYYWFHRANHEVRIFWAAHIVHHSSEQFNLGTGIRNGWFTLVYKPLFYMWMPALGFHPIMIMTCLAIESLWQFQLHSQFIPRMGFFEKFMNAHKHHHVHHSSNIEYLDKNHGGYLNLFDRMFGTFKDLDDSKPVAFGVLHPPESHHPMVILTHEYKNIIEDIKQSKTWKERLMYTFGPPGWSPDGSRKTVKQMQRELEALAEAGESPKEEPVLETV